MQNDCSHSLIINIMPFVSDNIVKIFTLPAAVVAKYCDGETTHMIFTKFLCMLTMAVARSSSSKVTKFQGEWAILGVFFPIDNAL